MKRHLRLVAIPSIATGIVAALGLLMWLGYRADWTGFGQFTGPAADKGQIFTRAKTFWDWLQLFIVPVVIALGIFWLNHQDAQHKLAADERRASTDRELAAESAREQALTQYFDTIAKLLLESDLRSSQPGSEVREVARAYTLAVVRRLDGYRKGMLLQFLSSAKLITRPDSEMVVDRAISYREDTQSPIVNLGGADFSDLRWREVAGPTPLSPASADLRTGLSSHLDAVDLADTDLRNVNLSNADLRSVNLNGAWLNHADLHQADCRSSQCWNTIFDEALLEGADFRGAQGEIAKLRKHRRGSPSLDPPDMFELRDSNKKVSAEEQAGKVSREMHEYVRYLGSLGFDVPEMRVQISIKDWLYKRPEQLAYYESTYYDTDDWHSFYDPKTQTISINASAVYDMDFPRVEYTYFVLKHARPDLETNMPDMLSLTQAIVYYLICSFTQNSRIFQGTIFDITIGDANEDETSTDARYKALRIWGSTFWAIRERLTQKLADDLLASAWRKMKGPEAGSDVTGSFTAALNKVTVENLAAEAQVTIANLVRERVYLI